MLRSIVALALLAAGGASAQPAPDVRARIREAASLAPRVVLPDGTSEAARLRALAREKDAFDGRTGLFDGAAGARYFPRRQALLEADPAAFLAARDAALAAMEADVSGPVALTISGGSSLGAYEAGVLFAYTLAQARWEELRTPDRAGTRSIPADVEPRFSAVTGTSAGGINAFVSAIASCQRPVDDPRDSLFGVWLEVDWNDLLDGRDPNTCTYFPGVLTRKKLEEQLARVTAAWRDDARWTPCEVDFALAVSHLFPRAIPLSPPEPGAVSSLALARTTERLALHFSGRPGKPPLITVRGGAELGVADALQPVIGAPHPPPRDPRERDLAEITPLLLATSGIPAVFNPLPLKLRYGTKDEESCFIDGGVFDNVPLGSAIRLAHLEQGRRAADWLRANPGKPLPTQPPPTYVYVDSDNTDQAEPELVKGKLATLEAYAALLGGLVTGARQAELVRTVEQNPDDLRRLMLPYRKHVITGELLNAFGAFFDRSFRRFDFLAGVADAERSLAGAPHFEELRRAGRYAPALPGLDCFRAVWSAADREGARAALTAGACAALRDTQGADAEARTLRDLWRLAKVTIELDRRKPDLAVALLTKLGEVEGARLADGGTRGYEYVTLRVGGHGAGPAEGVEAVREQLQRLVDRLGGHPFPVGTSLSTLGTQVASGALGYREVSHLGWAGLYGRGLEGGLDLPLLQRLDLAPSVQLADFAIGHRERPSRLDARAAVALRLDLPVSGSVQLQPAIAGVARAGYVSDRHPAYRLGIQPRLDVQLVQRVYFTVAWSSFRPAPGWPRSEVDLGLGFRFWR